MCPNENESVSSTRKIPAKFKEINWKLLGITLGIVFSAYGTFFGTHSYFLSKNIEAKEEIQKTELRILKEIVELSRIVLNLKIDSLIAQKGQLLKQSRSFAQREKKYIERIKNSKKLLTDKEIKDLLVTANESRAASKKQDSILSKLDLKVIQNNMWNKWEDLKVQQRPPIP